MYDDPEGTPAEREARLRETYRLMLLKDLRGVEFLTLLRLAHTEGRLAESMRAAGLPVIPVVYRALRLDLEGKVRQLWESRVQPICLRFLGLGRLIGIVSPIRLRSSR